MTLTVALAGDTMLGRGVAEELRRSPRPETPSFSDEVRAARSPRIWPRSVRRR